MWKMLLQMLDYWFSPLLLRDTLNSLILINNKGTSDTPQSKASSLQMKVKDKTHGKPPDQDVYLNICNTLILSDYQEKGYIYI